jgi:hypothetical protein
MNCAPSVKISSKCKSCFNKQDLLRIIKAYNNKNPKHKIPIKNKGQIQLWNDLRKALSSSCNKEVCWMDQDFVNRDTKKNLIEKFKPKFPIEWKKNKNAWLSTTDINEVMIQYEKLYKNFSFFGPVPVDCPNGIHCELSSLDPISLHRKNNINLIGIIFNLDYHYQSGSHWVALVIDTVASPYYVDFFDSYGEKPHHLITKFMDNMTTKLQKGGETIQIYNDKRHQFGHSECGIYSINYILERLKGKSPSELTKRIIKDSVMNEMRKYLYRME